MPNYVCYVIFRIILYPILKVNAAYYISFIPWLPLNSEQMSPLSNPQWIQVPFPEHLQVE